MLLRIEHLTKLRAFLQATSAKLDGEAATVMDGATALERSRLAAECRNLDREIELLTALNPKHLRNWPQ
jgi:hypothetical protein